MKRFQGSLTSLVGVLLLCLPAAADVLPGVYRVENVATPPGIAPEVSAIAFDQRGLLYAAFRRGTVHVLDPASGRWQKFAEGLQIPLGLLPGHPGEIIVAQRPELTRVADTDQDGVADVYETIADGWGLSGNYHEFIAGPVRDKAGDFYLSLGSSSGASEPRLPTRGKFVGGTRTAPTEKEGLVNSFSHYSPTPYRGCVVKVTAAGKVSPVACGLRQPNGIGVGPTGDVFVTDNQGDWIGSSPLHHVVPGAFFGHPASLVWDPTWKGPAPLEAEVDVLAKRRRLPIVVFPHNDMAGSPSQPLFDETRGAFGPYAGQMIVPDWSSPRLLRVDLEKVAGEWQGAAFILLEGEGLRPSGNRIAFAPDGKSLYVSQTSRQFGSVEGLQRVTWTGRVPMDILTMRLTTTGFEVTFTKPVNPTTARDPDAYSLTNYYYLYHGQYGSPKTDVTPVKIKKVTVSPDGRRVSLDLDRLVAGRIYELRPSRITAADGEALTTRIAAYTLNRLRASK
jgi:sugar lactone lactonase YvrE